MVAIGFTTNREKILSGEKRQTIRPDSKKWVDVYKRFVGYDIIKLQLYWHLRRPDCELLKIEILKNMTQIFLLYLTNEQAIKDGFKDRKEALGWFRNTYPKIDLEEKIFWIIEW